MHVKKWFTMRASGERGERYSRFPGELQAICLALVVCASAVIASPAQTFTTLTSFNGGNGANPDLMSLVQGSDGTLYGTTYGDGIHNFGTVFSISLSGSLTVLHTFSGPDGSTPLAGLVLGADGNLYGTTYLGGTSNAGTIFKITPAGSFSSIYSFTGGADGANPSAPLVQGPDGKFYGTAEAGGDDQYGTVFNLTPAGSLTPIHSFSGSTDGSSPYAGLALATDGNLYGTSSGSGDESPGTVFRVTTAGSFATIYNFCPSGGSCPNGQIPYARLVQGRDGNLYGTTIAGGSGNHGTVFKITLTGSFTPLYQFCPQNGCTDGANPYAGLVQASDGNFYGTTKVGGNGNNAGTIFSITSTGTLTTLYQFCPLSGCADGEYPYGGLIQASDGNFYGTTYQGGTSNDGTVFRLSPNYTLTVSISGSGMVTSTDGFIHCPGVCSHVYPSDTPVMLTATPTSGSIFSGWSGACSGTGPCNLIMNQNLSVTAEFSSNALLTVSTSGSGTVASMDGDINCPGVCGYSYPINTLVTLNAMPVQGWDFTGWSGACSGTGPCNVTMTQDLSLTATFMQEPNFYSLTVSTSGSGTVASTDGNINCPGTCSFTYPSGAQVTLNATPPPGGTFLGWSGACSGTGPCNLTMTQNLFVTAAFTGQQDMVMHSFGSGTDDGQTPMGSLFADAAGNLYGTTSGGGTQGVGTVFELSPSGAETILHNFGSVTNDGQTPLGNLIADSAGNLYGTTSAGGAHGMGTVFELSPNGTETVLYSFGNSPDGQNPHAGLVFDTAGNLYGTTLNGGANSGGTAFELSPSPAGGWTETVAYSFGSSGPSDGLKPLGNLVIDSGGNLYGTTSMGGTFGGGTAFELGPDTAPYRCCREITTYSFGNGMDGANPYAGLTFDNSGNLYGTTFHGGTNGGGTAFELSLSGGVLTESGSYSFGSNGPSDGLNPSSTLVFDSSSGNLYGTTQKGGLYADGTVFELFPNDVAPYRCCRENPVYNFGGNATDGQNPYAGVILGPTGTLYGTTVNGGAHGLGTVFGIVPTQVQFVPVTPCRVVDTRQADGSFGGPPISGGTTRSFPLGQGANPCNIPSYAIAYSLNVTVAPPGHLGYLTIWPTGQGQPLVSTLNSPDGRTKANAAIVPAGTPSGAISVYVTDTTNVILDIDGYFAAAGSQTLQFYPLPPCRLVDTRQTDGPLGGPRLPAQQERDFPLLMSSCIPAGVTPTAYSLNFTAVPNPPHQHLGYLTVWPAGQMQPVVSTLNNPTGTVVANGAIVPAGQMGQVAVYAYDTTDLLIDINGYFAVPGQGGYSFYPLTPCRVYDSRSNNGQPFSGNRTTNVVGSPCAPPVTAAGYILNATVVPNQRLGYLTLWPDSQMQPVVSTLNAYDGFVTSNLAIVPNVDGMTDAYAGDGSTQLILDISGYFAP